MNWQPIEPGSAERELHPDLEAAARASRVGLDDNDDDHDRFSERLSAKLKAEAKLDEQIARERRALETRHCPDSRDADRLKYNLAAYDEKYKGTDRERQGFVDTDWGQIEDELRDRPR